MTRPDSGQLLAELLLAIAVGITLAVIGAQLVGVSLTASESSKEQGEAAGLAQEAMEAVRAIIRGNDSSSQGWNRIYLPPDGTGGATSSKGDVNPYRPEISGGVWRLATSTENITVAGETYTRKLVIENTCRDPTSGSITTSTVSGPCPDDDKDDPATQKVNVIVSKTGSPDLRLEAFFHRGLVNEVTPQTSWSGGTNDGPFSATATVTTVGSGTTCIDSAAGSAKILSGC